MDSAELVTRRLRPTSVLPFIAWALLCFMQIISPAPAWSWMLVGLSVLLAACYLWARSLRDRVTASRQTIGAWVVAGDQLAERFSLTNQGWLPVLWARVKDGSAVPGYRADRVESAESYSTRRWAFAGICQRRGVFRLGPWDLQMSDPCGFFEVTHHYPTTTTILVYPRASHLPDVQLPSGRAPGRATVSERTLEDTVVVGGLRTYLPGDSLRRIHWRATAHHDQLMVAEFDREPSGDLWLVLDLDADVQAGQGAEATQEYAIILAASLASQTIRQGERRGVGMLMAGQAPALLTPARGQAQLWRILEALAKAEPAPGRPLATLLTEAGRTLGSGRTVVVITASQDLAWVAPLLPLVKRGNAPSVVLLDATTFDPPRGDPGALIGLQALLSQQHIPSTVLTQGFPFRPLERIRRQRQELRTLSGTGRVIQVQVEEEV